MGNLNSKIKMDNIHKTEFKKVLNLLALKENDIFANNQFTTLIISFLKDHFFVMPKSIDIDTTTLKTLDRKIDSIESILSVYALIKDAISAKSNQDVIQKAQFSKKLHRKALNVYLKKLAALIPTISSHDQILNLRDIFFEKICTLHFSEKFQEWPKISATPKDELRRSKFEFLLRIFKEFDGGKKEFLPEKDKEFSLEECLNFAKNINFSNVNKNFWLKVIREIDTIPPANFLSGVDCQFVAKNMIEGSIPKPDRNNSSEDPYFFNSILSENSSIDLSNFRDGIRSSSQENNTTLRMLRPLMLNQFQRSFGSNLQSNIRLPIFNGRHSVNSNALRDILDDVSSHNPISTDPSTFEKFEKESFPSLNLLLICLEESKAEYFDSVTHFIPPDFSFFQNASKNINSNSKILFEYEKSLQRIKLNKFFKISPSLKLCAILQKNLFKEMAIITKISHQKMDVFINYARRLLEISKTILFDFYSRLLQCGEDISKLGENFDISAQSRKILAQFLDNTLIGKILPLFFSALRIICGWSNFIDHVVLSKFILTETKEIIELIDKIRNNFFKEFNNKTPPVICGHQVVESLHPYYQLNEYSGLVRIPGATHLCLQFDRKSCIHDRDKLLIETIDGKNISTFLMSVNLPVGLTIFEGDSLRYKLKTSQNNGFNFGDHNDFYGFKMIIKGFNFNSMSFYSNLGEISVLASSVIGRIYKSVFSSVSLKKNEIDFEKWFKTINLNNSNQFNKNEPNQKILKKEKIKNLLFKLSDVNNSSEKEKIEKIDKIDKKVQIFRKIMDNHSGLKSGVFKTGKKINMVADKFIVACIIQTTMGENVYNFIKNYEKAKDNEKIVIPKSLIQIWKLTKDLKNFILTERHKLLGKSDSETESEIKQKINNFYQKIIDKLDYLIKNSTISSNYLSEEEFNNGLSYLNFAVNKNVFGFVKNPSSVQEYLDFVDISKKRALMRIEGLKNITRMMEKIKDEISLISLLTNLLKGQIYVKLFKTIELVDHETSFKVVQANNFFLETLFISFDKTKSQQLKALILSTIGIFTNSEIYLIILDLQYHQKLYQIAQNSKNCPLLYNIAQYLKNITIFNFATIRNCKYQFFNDDFKNFWENNLKKIRNQSLKRILDELKNVFSTYNTVKKQTIKTISKTKGIFYKNGNAFNLDNIIFRKSLKSNKDDFFKVEENIFKQLGILNFITFEMADNNKIDEIDYKFTVPFIVTLIDNVSQRSKKICIQIIGTLLEKLLDLKSINSNWILKSTTLYKIHDFRSLNLPQNGLRLILSIFSRIGELMFETEKSDSTENSDFQKNKTENFCSLNFQSGFVFQESCLDFVSLIRRLLKCDQWKSVIMSVIEVFILKIPDLVSNNRWSSQSKNNLRMAIASLCVIGGFPEIFRVGGIVVNKDKGENQNNCGIITSFCREKNKCEVIFPSNRTLVISCDLTKLLINPGIGKKILKNFSSKFQASLINLLVLLTQKTLKLDRKSIEFKLITSKKRKIDTKRENWPCSLCTFLNNFNATVCAMCNSTRPKSAVQIESNENNTKSNKKEKPAKKISQEEFILSQLKSRTIKAFCRMFLVSSSLLKNNDLFKTLVKIATTPTQLNEFASMCSLEAKETRLLEKISEKANNVTEVDGQNISTGQSIAEIIPFSPYKYLQTKIPTQFDIKFTAVKGFEIDNKNRTIYSTKPLLKNVFYGMGDCVIPIEARIFYFELTILDSKGPLLTKNGGFGAAIGLYRSGTNVKGAPGNEYSYAYLAKSGRLVHNNIVITTATKNEEKTKLKYFKKVKLSPEFSSSNMTLTEKSASNLPENTKNLNYLEAFENKWGEKGDVIGCGFDSVKKYIFFTKNGKILNDAIFQNISGRFCPMIWVDMPFLKLKANFGQEKYKFDISQLLPADYLETLSKGFDEMSPREKKRRAMAEHLVEIMGNFPLEICVVALERAEDDMESATNWLIENGWKELERMGDALLNGKDSAKPNNANRSNNLENLQAAESDSNSEDFSLGESFGYDSYQSNISRMYLYEDLEQNIPLGIDRREVTQENESSGRIALSPFKSRYKKDYFEELNFEDIEPGQILQISENLVRVMPEIAKDAHLIAGKLGVVQFVEEFTGWISLWVGDQNTGICGTFGLPIYCVHKPARLWNDPIKKEIEKLKLTEEYLAEYHSVVEALSILRIRSAVFTVLENLPQNDCSLYLFGGKAIFLNFVKLVSAEYLSINEHYGNKSLSSSQKAYSELKTIRKKLSCVLKAEFAQESDSARPIEITRTIYKDAEKLNSAAQKIRLDPSISLNRLAAEETILHFVQAANCPIPTLTFSSPGHNPYEKHCRKSGKIYIPGATALMFTFDKRCDLSEDLMTCLKFFKDENRYELLSVHLGRKGNHDYNCYNRFIIQSNQCYYTFTSSENTNFFGFKFKVSPIDLRIDDNQALNCLNFELGCWLLNLLMENTPENIIHKTMPYLYDALAWYVKKGKISIKSKGLRLLNKVMLRFIQQSKISKSLLSRFSSLEKESEKILSKMFNMQNSKKMQTRINQKFLELAVIFDCIKQKQTSQNETGLFEKLVAKMDQNKIVTQNILSSYKIKLIDATFIFSDGLLHNATAEINQSLVETEGILLIIPSKENWGEYLPKVNPEKLKNASLSLSFKVMRTYMNNDGVIIEEEIVAFQELSQGKNPYIFSAESTISVSIKELSRILLGLSGLKSNLIPIELDAKRLENITKNYYTILKHAKFNDKSTLMSRPCPLNFSELSINSFSLSFWLYLEKKPENKSLFLISKGVAQRIASSMFVFTDPKMTLRVQLATKFPMTELFSGPKLIPIKKWTHIAICCKGRDVQLHVGGESSQIYRSGPIANNFDPFFIGVPKFGVVKIAKSFESINGEIGDVRWYFNFLSVEEIKNIFNKGPENIKNFKTQQIDNKNNINKFKSLKISDSSKDSSKNSLKINKNSKIRRIFWTKEMDQQLIDFAGKQAENKQKQKEKESIKNYQNAHLRPPEESRSRAEFSIPNSVQQNMPSLSESLQIPLRSLEQSSSISDISRHSESIVLSENLYNSEDMDADLVEDEFDVDSDIEINFADFDGEGPTYHFERISEINPQFLCKSRADYANYPLLCKLTPEDLKERLIITRILNSKIDKIAHLVDFSEVETTGSLANRIASLRHLVYYSTKYVILRKLLEQTSVSRRNRIRINRAKALKAREKEAFPGLKSIFGQMYLQLNFINPSDLRFNSRMLHISYVGEGGQDAGGIYRDTLSAICDELQSPDSNLLILSPNGRAKYGNNQDKYIIAPNAISDVQLSMFFFLGKLIGMAIRCRNVLNLNLAPTVWKPLVGLPLSRKDLYSIDSNFIDLLNSLESLDESHADSFEQTFGLTFTSTRSDGEEIGLLSSPSESARPLKFSERLEFVRLSEKARLEESTAQIQAIRKGLATVVPIDLLHLFSEKELEFTVCGKGRIDVDFLKKNTRYKSCTKENDPHIVWLWEVLREFSQEDRQKFLRFVWGQSRLPLTNADFREKFVISTLKRRSDESLPTSHTCFFSLELPKYSSKEILKQKLEYAIRYCTAIDTDFHPNNENWDE